LIAEYFGFLTLDLILILVFTLLVIVQKEYFISIKKSVINSILVSSIILFTIDSVLTNYLLLIYKPNTNLGLFVLNIPLEKYIYTSCILGIALLSYTLVKEKLDYINRKWLVRIIGSILILLTLPLVYIHWYDIHSFIAISLLNLSLFYLLIKAPKWSINFLVTFLALLIPYSLLSAFLGGSFSSSPLMLYNSLETQGVYITSFPLENLFYWFVVLCFIIFVFEKLENLKEL